MFVLAPFPVITVPDSAANMLNSPVRASARVLPSTRCRLPGHDAVAGAAMAGEGQTVAAVDAPAQGRDIKQDQERDHHDEFHPNTYNFLLRPRMSFITLSIF